jgi:hypothetical protein
VRIIVPHQFFRITLGKKLGIPVIALAILTFGDYAKWHPHVHALVSDGLFTETRYFYVMPKGDVRLLDELFRALDLKMLEDEGRLDDALIKKILTWRHNSGFSVHNEVLIQAGDAKGIENLAQYIIRNTYSLTKLNFIKKIGTIIYCSKMSHGGNKRNLQTFSLLKFIAAVCQHIPERLAQMVRYVG